MKPLIVNAIFKGGDERFNKNEIYHLEIRNNGARLGRSEGPHDLVTIPLLSIAYPCTLKGFLQNWEIVEIYG